MDKTGTSGVYLPTGPDILAVIGRKCPGKGQFRRSGEATTSRRGGSTRFSFHLPKWPFIATLLGSFTEKAGKTMARRLRNHALRWKSKKANHGRKPSKGRIKGWSVKHYSHL